MGASLEGMQNWGGNMFLHNPNDPNYTDESQDFLKRLQTYDPNAKFTDRGVNENGQSLGWGLDYDISKLPTNKVSNQHGNFGAEYIGDNIIDQSGNRTGYSKEHLYNPDAYVNDPVYGKITDPKNWHDTGFDAINTLGPIAMAAITAGAGMGMLPAMMAPEALAGTLGGLQGLSSASGLWGAGGIGGAGAGLGAAAGAGNSAVNNFMNKYGMNLAKQVPGMTKGNFNPLGLLSTLGPAALGMAGINMPSIPGAAYLSKLYGMYNTGKGVYNAVKGGR